MQRGYRAAAGMDRGGRAGPLRACPTPAPVPRAPFYEERLFYERLPPSASISRRDRGPALVGRLVVDHEDAAAPPITVTAVRAMAQIGIDGDEQHVGGFEWQTEETGRRGNERDGHDARHARTTRNWRAGKRPTEPRVPAMEKCRP